MAEVVVFFDGRENGRSTGFGVKVEVHSFLSVP